MKKAVWAIFFHKSSTDENPMHMFCPKNKESWCGYNRGPETGEMYNHRHSLPAAVMNTIKPTFRALADPKLLEKCLHGKTQNPNESLKFLIQQRSPKTGFVGSKVLQIAVYDAALCFNSGYASRIDVLKELGITPGKFRMQIIRDVNKKKLAKAEMSMNELIKEARIKKMRQKRAQQDTQDDEAYGYGAF